MVSAKHAQKIAIGLGLALGLVFCLGLEAFGAPFGPTLCWPDLAHGSAPPHGAEMPADHAG